MEQGRFALLVDRRADAWRDALARVGHPLAALIDVVAVGPGHAVSPNDERWSALREVGGDGALLVRPDTIVAWRSQELPDEPTTALERALASVLRPTARPAVR